MLKDYRRIELENGININLYEIEKFKSNLLSFYFKRPLARKEITMNALIPLVLKRGTKDYDSSKLIDRRLEELYGSSLSIGINKKGEKQVLRFSIEWASELYTDEKGLDYSCIDMLDEIIFNPYLEDNVFSEKYVTQEKINLEKMITGKINNKRNYVVNKCIETMCKNERFGHYSLGYVEDISDITSEDLYEQYVNIINESPLEIIYVGNNIKDIEKYLLDKFSHDRGEMVYIREDFILEDIQNKKLVKEEMDITQGKLAIGYRSNIKYKDPLYKGLVLGNLIFGGDPTSKLFKNVREKENLAYSIGSSIYKYKSILMVDAGVDFENIDKTIDIINLELDEIKKGNFTEEDITNAKQNLLSAYESIDDSQFGISETVFAKSISEDYTNLIEVLDSYMTTSKEEIIEAMNTLSIDTIYCLNNK